MTVRRYVAQYRRHSAEVFVPLSQPPGEAQFDFGEATVEIAGERVKAALAVMTLPCSDAFLVSAYPREWTETFQASHVAAVSFFGGVPRTPFYARGDLGGHLGIYGVDRATGTQVSQILVEPIGQGSLLSMRKPCKTSGIPHRRHS